MTLTGIGGNATVDTAGYAVTLSGVLSGPGGLNKIGSGTLTLSGTGSFTGGIYVSGGTLKAASFMIDNSCWGICGGSLDLGYQYIGGSGGIFTQTGGTNSVSNYLCLGYTSGSNGTYTLTGGTLSTGV